MLQSLTKILFSKFIAVALFFLVSDLHAEESLEAESLKMAPHQTLEKDDIRQENGRLKAWLKTLQDKPVTCILVALNIILHVIQSMGYNFDNYCFNASK